MSYIALHFPALAVNQTSSSFEFQEKDQAGQQQNNLHFFQSALQDGKINEIVAFMEKNKFPEIHIKTLLEDLAPNAGYQDLMLAHPSKTTRNWKNEFNFWVLKFYIRTGKIKEICDHFRKYGFPDDETSLLIIRQLADTCGYYKLAKALKSNTAWFWTFSSTLESEVKDVNYYKTKLFDGAEAGRIVVFYEAIYSNIENCIGDKFMGMINEKGQTLSQVAEMHGYLLLSELLASDAKTLREKFKTPGWKENFGKEIKEEAIDENIKKIYAFANDKSPSKSFNKNILTWPVFLRLREKYAKDLDEGRDQFANTYLSFILQHSAKLDKTIYRMILREKLFLHRLEDIKSMRKDDIGAKRSDVKKGSLIDDKAKAIFKNALIEGEIDLMDDLIKGGIDLSYTNRNGESFSDLAFADEKYELSFALQSVFHWCLFDLALLKSLMSLQ